MSPDPETPTMSGEDVRRPTHRVGRPKNPMSADDVRRAAAAIIAEKGYHATTIRDIAEALGVRKATIQHHIGSKANLLFTLIESLVLPGRRIMEEVEGTPGDARTRVRLFVKLTLERIAANPVVSQVLVHEFRSLTGDYLARATEIRDEYTNLLVSLIKEGQKSGEFNPELDARVAAISFLLMLNSLNEWYEPDGRLDLEKIIDAQVTLVLSGLADPAS